MVKAQCYFESEGKFDQVSISVMIVSIRSVSPPIECLITSVNESANEIWNELTTSRALELKSHSFSLKGNRRLILTYSINLSTQIYHILKGDQTSKHSHCKTNDFLT